MKVGAVSLGWGDKPLARVFEDIRAIGGECLELNSRPGLHAGLVLEPDTIPQVRDWAAMAGVQISGIGGYNDFAQGDPDALQLEVERLLAACRLASELGVRIVRAFAGDARPGLSLTAAWPALVTGFQRVARLAEPLGVTLAIENHGHLLNDGPMLARLVQEVGASNVGLTLDSGNFCWAGHSLEQAQADFDSALPYTVNVHIKDGVWRENRFEFVPAGEGDLPLNNWLAALANRGYQGAVCSEFEGTGDFMEGTRRSIRYLSSLILSR